jgi:D-alanyl-D-alanine carboxypeptidase
MRLRARVVSLIAVTVIAAGVTACAPAAGKDNPRPGKQVAIAPTSPPATPSHPSPSVTPSHPSPSVTPAIQVTGAPGGVKAKGAVLADAATGQILWVAALTPNGRWRVSPR